jgi:hypothetical protein
MRHSRTVGEALQGMALYHRFNRLQPPAGAVRAALGGFRGGLFPGAAG